MFFFITIQILLSNTIMNLSLYVHALKFIASVKTPITLKFQHDIEDVGGNSGISILISEASYQNLSLFATSI